MQELQIAGAAPYVVENYLTREHWLQARTSFIGGSEVSALFTDEDGEVYSPFNDEWSLYQQKIGLANMSKEESNAMRAGLFMEDGIARWYAEENGRVLLPHRDFQVFRSTDPRFLTATGKSFIAVTPDRLIEAYDHRGNGVLSVKNVSYFKGAEWDVGTISPARAAAALKKMADEWEPPTHYQMQLQMEMFVIGLRWGAFAVLVGGQIPVWFEVDRDDEWIEEVLLPRVAQFWKRVEKRLPPPCNGTRSACDTVKRLHPLEVAGKIIKLPPQAEKWNAQLVKINDQMDKLIKRKEKIRNFLKLAIGDNEGGTLADGTFWRWKSVHKVAHTVKEQDYRELRRLKGVPKDKKGQVS